MGHLVSLAVKRGRIPDYEELFEAKNLLPFFWPFLIGTSDWERAASALIEWSQLEGEELDQFMATAPLKTNVDVEARSGIERAKSRRSNIVRSAPEHLSLFDEWITYLEEWLVTGVSEFSLDIAMLSEFSSVDEYIAELHAKIAELDSGRASLVPMAHPTQVAEWTGWAVPEQAEHFRQRSEAYRNFEAGDRERFRLAASDAKSSERPKKFWSRLFGR